MFLSLSIIFFSILKKRSSGCWRYDLPSEIIPITSTDKCQLIFEQQLNDADDPWACEDLGNVAGEQIELRALDEPNDQTDTLASKTQTSSVDSETEPTFSVSRTHASRTARTQADAQRVTSRAWDPAGYSHTAAMVELEMDDLTLEQQMSTSSAVASGLSGQTSSSVRLQQSDVESQQDDSTAIGEDIEMRQRHNEHPLYDQKSHKPSFKYQSL